jgi:hypothetical protein
MKATRGSALSCGAGASVRGTIRRRLKSSVLSLCFQNGKENLCEAEMVLKCVRYLGQQGYGTEDIVVLTPYLGQLYPLVNTLSKENDPILNDLDSHELIQAGLITPASANIVRG